MTGGAGLIGSHIVDRLLARGYEARIVDCLAQPCHRSGRRPPWLPHDAEFIEGDVQDKALMTRALAGVDLVFHEAAHQGLMPDFSRFFQVNAAGTALLYEVIVENRYPVRKVVIASSQAVYNEGLYRCRKHGVLQPNSRLLERLERGLWEVACPRCGEGMPPVPTSEERANPQTMYAQSKLAQERIGMHLGRLYGVPTVALRYAITQGPRQSLYNAYSGVCSVFALRLANGQPPVVYEDGLQTRDYVFVGDVADANLFVAERPETDFGVFNVGTGRATTVLEFVKALSRVMGRRIEPDFSGAFRLGDIRHFTPEVSRLTSLGWRATTPLEDTLRRYAEWLEEQGPVADPFPEAEATMRRLGVLRPVVA